MRVVITQYIVYGYVYLHDIAKWKGKRNTRGRCLKMILYLSFTFASLKIS